jgi:hypothetical protein
MKDINIQTKDSEGFFLCNFIVSLNDESPSFQSDLTQIVYQTCRTDIGRYPFPLSGFTGKAIDTVTEEVLLEVDFKDVPEN